MLVPETLIPVPLLGEETLYELQLLRMLKLSSTKIIPGPATFSSYIIAIRTTPTSTVLPTGTASFPLGTNFPRNFR